LARFTEISALEPDPVAGLLLRRRLRGLAVRARVDATDRLIAPLVQGTRGLPELIREDPSACVIFCNVLGQTRFLVSDAAFSQFKAAFRERVLPALDGRAWLSFHDRVSGPLRPNFAAPLASPARLSDEAVLRELYRTDQAGPSAELLDHESDGFFPEQLAHSYFSWQIDRQRYHLIEAVRSPDGAPGEGAR
jgi:hypothetical protein